MGRLGKCELLIGSSNRDVACIRVDKCGRQLLPPDDHALWPSYSRVLCSERVYSACVCRRGGVGVHDPRCPRSRARPVLLRSQPEPHYKSKQHSKSEPRLRKTENPKDPSLFIPVLRAPQQARQTAEPHYGQRYSPSLEPHCPSLTFVGEPVTTVRAKQHPPQSELKYFTCYFK